MKLDVGRLKKLFTSPREYWTDVVTEPGGIKSLLVPQMLILAAIPAISSFLGSLTAQIRFGFFSGSLVVGGLIGLLLSYGLNIGLWIAMGYIIDALAEPFGARKDIDQAMKLSTGAVIPMWLGAVLGVAPLSGLGMLGMLVGMGYGAYVLHLGLPTLNGTPQDKAIGFAAAVIGILFVIGLVAAFMAGCPVACLFAPTLLR